MNRPGIDGNEPWIEDPEGKAIADTAFQNAGPPNGLSGKAAVVEGNYGLALSVVRQKRLVFKGHR